MSQLTELTDVEFLSLAFALVNTGTGGGKERWLVEEILQRQPRYLLEPPAYWENLLDQLFNK